MKHPRTLIRESLKARLAAELDGGAYPTPAGARWFVSREVPLNKAKLPAGIIYDDAESRDGDAWTGKPKRVVEVTLEAWTTAADEEALDAALDVMALAIEMVVDKDPYMEGNAEKTEYQGTEKERWIEAKRAVGAVYITYDVTYLMPNYGFEELDDLLQFNVDHDMAPADGDLEAQDIVTVPGPED